jgi:hypothetical protein
MLFHGLLRRAMCMDGYLARMAGRTPLALPNVAGSLVFSLYANVLL